VHQNEAGLQVEGELTLHGATRPLTFEVVVGDDGTLTADAVIKQTDYGMKPYSTLFGALKVVDEVAIEIEARLPQVS
jgi:polyisoprenoid-binding protein YceI